jgi:hypothetical protein
MRNQKFTAVWQATMESTGCVLRPAIPWSKLECISSSIQNGAQVIKSAGLKVKEETLHLLEMLISQHLNAPFNKNKASTSTCHTTTDDMAF